MSSADKERPTLLIVIAHPDDESFGCGALIASAAASGKRVVVACASRGERGDDVSGLYPDHEALATARELELRSAADVLGVSDVILLDLVDSGWDGPAEPGSICAETDELIRRISRVLVEYRPGVVVTLDPTGSDGHRDHAAVGHAATAAFDQTVEWPASLYHWCLPHSLMDAWSREIAARNPDSVYLETELGRPDADVTTVLDGAAVLAQVWKAIGSHQTQTTPYEAISRELADRFVQCDHLIRQRPPWPQGAAAPLERELLWPTSERKSTDDRSGRRDAANVSWM